MKLSVVIPCFNERAVVGRQLRALAAQRFEEPWEVVLADNGSTDGSPDEARRLQSELPSLTVLDASARKGAAYARNAGVRAARGELIAFCDADDEVAADWVEHMARGVEQHGFVACRLDDSKLNPPSLARYRNLVQRAGLQRGPVHPSLAYAGGGTLGIRRTLHDAVNGFDESLLAHEDTDYCLRVQEATGVELTFVPEALIQLSWPEGFWPGFRQLRSWGKKKVAVQRRHAPEVFERLGATGQAWRFAKHCLGVRRVRDVPALERWAMALGGELGALEGMLSERLKAR